MALAEKWVVKLVKAVYNDPDLTLVGGIDPTKAGGRCRAL